MFLEADDVEIANNIFEASGKREEGTNTAFEVHGSNFNITGNTIRNYNNGILVVSNARHASENIMITNNTMSGVVSGVTIWSVPYGGYTSGYGINGLTVQNNNIELDGYDIVNNGIGLFPGEAGADWHLLPVKNINILNNSLKFDLVTGGNSFWGGMIYWTIAPQTVEDLTIRGNIIENAPGSGIKLAAQAEFHNALIENNVIKNPGSTLNSGPSAYRSGVEISPEINSYNIVVANNVISDEYATTRMGYGITGGAANGQVTNVQWLENQITILGVAKSEFLKIGDKYYTGSYWLRDNNLKPLIIGNADNFEPPAFGSVTFLAKTGTKITDTVNQKEWTISADGNFWLENDNSVPAAPSGVQVY
jgi:hypothetical protein